MRNKFWYFCTTFRSISALFLSRKLLIVRIFTQMPPIRTLKMITLKMKYMTWKSLTNFYKYSYIFWNNQIHLKNFLQHQIFYTTLLLRKFSTVQKFLYYFLSTVYTCGWSVVRGDDIIVSQLGRGSKFKPHLKFWANRDCSVHLRPSLSVIGCARRIY